MARRKQDAVKADRNPGKARRPSEADYDSPWKGVLDRYFEPCLAFFFPLAHAASRKAEGGRRNKSPREHGP